MEKIPAGSFGQRHNVQVCVSLSPGFTKASNRVENLLEARGLGLQLFFEGLSGERMAVLTTLPLFVLCSVPLSDGLSQKPEPPQLDPAKPGLGWAVCLLSVSLDTSRFAESPPPAACNEQKCFSTEATLSDLYFFKEKLEKKQIIPAL